MKGKESYSQQGTPVHAIRRSTAVYGCPCVPLYQYVPRTYTDGSSRLATVPSDGRRCNYIHCFNDGCRMRFKGHFE